ncbi:MAG: TlyA family RNA methyltransferase [Bacillota bacterium]
MKVRLDLLLVERGLAATRSLAQALVMAGQVLVGGEPVTKAGARFAPDVDIQVLAASQPYVSRGGAKLQGALVDFEVQVHDRVCLDVGASTGGFTDCLLQHGARRVYAVDVGYGQLAWKLRQDPRVVVLERTNARHLGLAQLGEPVGLATVDVAFISLELIWPALFGVMEPGADALCLVKPQFEAGRSQVGKRGVVKDPAVHRQVLERLVDAAPRAGFSIRGLAFSRLRGPEGNLEFWLWLQAGRWPQAPVEPGQVVSEAHRWHREERWAFPEKS